MSTQFTIRNEHHPRGTLGAIGQEQRKDGIRLPVRLSDNALSTGCGGSVEAMKLADQSIQLGGCDGS